MRKIISRILQQIHESYAVGAAAHACMKIDPIKDHVSKLKITTIPTYIDPAKEDPHHIQVMDTRVQTRPYNKCNLHPNKE